MTREEALLTVTEIVNGWSSPHEWTNERLEAYAGAIEDMDYAVTAKALRLMVRQVRFRPAISELREFVEGQKRGMAQPSPDDLIPRSKPPAWIFRWVAARLLYSRFDREQDMRTFPEQREWADPTIAVMPPDEWVKEAAQISEREVFAAVQNPVLGGTA